MFPIVIFRMKKTKKMIRLNFNKRQKVTYSSYIDDLVVDFKQGGIYYDILTTHISPASREESAGAIHSQQI